MKEAEYRALDAARAEFRALVDSLQKELPDLALLQEKLRLELGYDDYRVETPIVYNRALDGIGPSDRFSYILVADNPGKKEQLLVNNRYLVGQSGKLAEGFFRRELDLDFRREVLILNKTPIHTPKTGELRRLLALGADAGGTTGKRLRTAFEESQRAMAGLARRLHGETGTVLWLSGLGELGPKGIFRPYAEALGLAYRDAPASLRDKVWLFRHFSMNQFSQEVRKNADPAKPLLAELERIGVENRRRVLGW